MSVGPELCSARVGSRAPLICDNIRGMDTVLSARGLVKEFKRAIAVDGVDIEVKAGERVALLGPNGAGKTTTLLMILGAISPDKGEVEICGVAQQGNRSKAAENVGFAAGYLPLAGEMKVREYLTMFGEIYGIPDPSKAIAEGLERFRIQHLSEAKGTQLSSGQRTLVGIVRAVLHKPRLLVLDEPTASLDPDVAGRVRSGILDLCADNGTALLVTSHDMLEVERLCERVLFLSAGRVVADGAPSEIAERFGREDLEGVFLHLADENYQHSDSPTSQHTDHIL
ncbi:MAG: ABC transporter ATP-binding protein [Acidimicrobiia bacterium]|nr:ABC transporter ATP-binding protein [Acidimicrobiia bacterium]